MQKLSWIFFERAYQQSKDWDISTTAVHHSNYVVHSLWTWLGHRSLGNRKTQQLLHSIHVFYTFCNCYQFPWAADLHPTLCTVKGGQGRVGKMVLQGHQKRLLRLYLFSIRPFLPPSKDQPITTAFSNQHLQDNQDAGFASQHGFSIFVNSN